ncbi:hypothetical protein ACPC27_30015 [Streptomyces cellulosae]
MTVEQVAADFGVHAMTLWKVDAQESGRPLREVVDDAGGVGMGSADVCRTR